MFGIGTTELLIVLAIVVVLFGARRLPELASPARTRSTSPRSPTR
jgi:Sec-independent protein translocase protein TatA